MAEFKTLEVAGWLPALKGMRNPLKSYSRNDSYIASDNYVVIGKNDYDLAKRLILAGPEHRKFLRQIVVWVDITLPRFIWSEFDTYKIGTATNSESTMHTLLKEPITKDMFEINFDLEDDDIEQDFEQYLNLLENIRNVANDSDNKNDYHLLLKSLLPESFKQTRTVCLNYEVLSNMYHQRKNHRLPQWNKDFVSWIYTLPYSEFITQQFDKN